MAAPAAVPGLNFGPEVTYILAAVLIITGLALAFWGHGLWATVMSMIGALLGSAVGFLFGAALGGLIPGLILALVGAVIGSILFTKLVKVARAFLLGALVQTAAIKKKNRARTRAVPTPPPPPPPPPPAL